MLNPRAFPFLFHLTQNPPLPAPKIVNSGQNPYTNTYKCNVYSAIQFQAYSQI